MLLLCGATGLLGGRIAALLAERDVRFRALLRPSADARATAALGAEIARGDLRDPGSLVDAVADADTIVTTVTSMSRLLAGGERTTVAATDRRGTLNLVDAAERAGARRFVFVSYAGLAPHHRFPLARAKRAVEERLRASALREVLVRPVPFQEVWLSPAVGLDWPNGKLTVYGRGDNPVAYVAVPDVARAIVELALAPDPPPLVELAGPEALTRNQIAELLRERTGRELAVRRVPRPALVAGSRVLAPFKQELASVMGLALALDRDPHPWDDAALRELGIAARPASAHIRELTARQ